VAGAFLRAIEFSVIPTGAGRFFPRTPFVRGPWGGGTVATL